MARSRPPTRPNFSLSRPTPKASSSRGTCSSAENVDIVKDLLDPAAYWQIKHDGRLVDLAPTETDVTKLTPMPYLQATLRNRGKHKIFPDGNCYTLDGKDWVGGNPFPGAPNGAGSSDGQYLELGQARYARLTRYSTGTPMPTAPSNISTPPTTVEWQTVGRLIFDPHPYMPGRENQLRILWRHRGGPRRRQRHRHPAGLDLRPAPAPRLLCLPADHKTRTHISCRSAFRASIPRQHVFRLPSTG